MKKLSVFLCAMAMVFGIVGTAKSAPMLWAVTDGGNGHWYDVIFHTTNWNDAKQLAKQSWHNGLQGHLVSITSSEEQDWVWNTFPYGKKWLGGYQADNTVEPDKGWAWVTGENWDYTNWKEGEPNDDLGTEDWLVFSASNDGKWNDQHLDGVNKVTGYVVEYEAVPIPSAIWLLGSAFIGLVGFRKFRKEA